MDTTLLSEAGTKLAWDGLHNARDLGGHPTPTGWTRYRAVVRSEVPNRLTRDGHRQLEEHGIVGFLDLRSRAETDREPSPFAKHPGYRLVPLLDRAAMDGVRSMTESEELFEYLLLDRAALIGEALGTLLLLSAEGGALVHCRAGKDRTGIVAGLLLANAGVPWKTIADEHARSDANLAPLFTIWAAEAIGEEERALASMRRFVPTRRSMLRALGQVTAHFGSVAGYLVEAGLTQHEVKGLRALLATGPRRQTASLNLRSRRP